MSAYDEMYLEDATRTLASAFDFAFHICNVDLDSFVHMFITSRLAESFEKGFPRVICGMSGLELSMEVFSRVGYEYSLAEEDYDYDSSPEYWCGWMLAYYQWKTGRSFKEIIDCVSIREIVTLYDPLHEASEDKFVVTLDEIIKKRSLVSKLQMYRKRSGLTQKELSEMANVNLRTLQQYELKAKDLSKASVSTLINLSSILGCDIKALLG